MSPDNFLNIEPVGKLKTQSLSLVVKLIFPLYLVGLGWNEATRNNLVRDLDIDGPFNLELCKFPLNFKFDNVNRLYPRTGTYGDAEASFLDLAVYSRPAENNFQLVTVPMSFENCYYNRFSEQYLKVGLLLPKKSPLRLC